MTLSESTIIRIVKVLAKTQKYDGGIWWREIDGNILAYVNCSDIFHWGTADAEEINNENVSVLEECVADCEAAEGFDRWDGEDEPFWLFCARIKNMRPQGAVYSRILEPWSKKLFDEAGEERKIDLFNPYDTENNYKYEAEQGGLSRN